MWKKTFERNINKKKRTGLEQSLDSYPSNLFICPGDSARLQTCHRVRLLAGHNAEGGEICTSLPQRTRKMQRTLVEVVIEPRIEAHPQDASIFPRVNQLRVPQ